MPRGFATATVLGYAGKDPETFNFDNGGMVANVSIASTQSWKDSKGEKQERTEWTPVVFHNGLADIAAKYVHKGSLIWITGNLQTRTYKKDGKDHYITEVHANEIQLLDKKPE